MAETIRYFVKEPSRVWVQHIWPQHLAIYQRVAGDHDVVLHVQLDEQGETPNEYNTGERDTSGRPTPNVRVPDCAILVAIEGDFGNRKSFYEAVSESFKARGIAPFGSGVEAVEQTSRFGNVIRYEAKVK